MPPRIKSVKIKGYRPFGDFSAQLGPLEVIVGANGSGKSSLFEFLRFLRDSMTEDIPPRIVPGPAGQRIFHSPGPERLSWDIETDITDFPRDYPIRYQGEVAGIVGLARVTYEIVQTAPPKEEEPRLLMKVSESRLFKREGFAEYYFPGESGERDISLDRASQLALSIANSPVMPNLYKLREYIRGWRFYNSFNIAHDKIRTAALVEQEPVLEENAGNLSSLLHYLMTEHQSAFNELQQILRSTVPGFRRLTVKARGAPGEIIAFWQEDGVESELSLSDLSDGILQLICWAVLCLQPNPPSLICIDEPDQGVHPRTLPVLAGLFKKASNRTQILLATHSSYFLTLFDLSRIAVMRKEDGEAKFLKPKDSKVLTEILKDFGPEEIENLHISDELEYFA